MMTDVPAAAPGSLTGRIFVALCPDPAARARIVAWQRRQAWSPGTRVASPQDLHLTLHFIGPVAVQRLPDICVGLSVPSAPIELELDAAVLWPRGLAVLLARRVPDVLQRLHGDLAQALRRLQLPVDARPYQAHVTLARNAAGTPALELPFAPIAFRSPSQVLAVRDGPHYRVLQRYPGAEGT